jgi:IS30 family transposase
VARPTKEPTEEQRRQVETLSGYGLTQEQIARMLGVHVQTLRKHCDLEMKSGKDRAYTQAVNSLFANIKKGKEASIFFYLKTQHHWRERSEVTLSNPDGSALQAVIEIVPHGKKPN